MKFGFVRNHLMNFFLWNYIWRGIHEIISQCHHQWVKRCHFSWRVLNSVVNLHDFAGWFLKLRDRPEYDQTSWFSWHVILRISILTSTTIICVYQYIYDLKSLCMLYYEVGICLYWIRTRQMDIYRWCMRYPHEHYIIYSTSKVLEFWPYNNIPSIIVESDFTNLRLVGIAKIVWKMNRVEIRA